ncbi:hypothetical protein [Rhizobium sp. RU36D]|uniref:hypothetical protein n=1 Tax=Rhizobium sp. RU36D TaxID=1907415 RepID=UPI0009FD366C|nr:hypothetical protein [Rhizobium sp. RU36D]
MSEPYQEKHSVRTEFHKATGIPWRVTWYNALGDQDAPGDLPSEMGFGENGALVYAFWKKDGKFNRDNDLPTRIYYDENSGKPYHFRWEKDDLEHRDGDKPSTIG